LPKSTAMGWDIRSGQQFDHGMGRGGPAGRRFLFHKRSPFRFDLGNRENHGTLVATCFKQGPGSWRLSTQSSIGGRVQQQITGKSRAHDAESRPHAPGRRPNHQKPLTAGTAGWWGGGGVPAAAGNPPAQGDRPFAVVGRQGQIGLPRCPGPEAVQPGPGAPASPRSWARKGRLQRAARLPPVAGQEAEGSWGWLAPAWRRNC